MTRRYQLSSVRGVLMVRAAVHHGDVVRVIKLVVDTGASKTVLSWSIMEGLGYDPASVKKRVRLVTASGFELAPQVSLDRFHKSPPLDTPQLSWGEESGDSPEADHAVSME